MSHSALHKLTDFFSICLLLVTQAYGNAILSRWSSPATGHFCVHTKGMKAFSSTLFKKTMVSYI